MRKIVIVIVLFCTLYSAYSLDYRQVLFGNSYKNIVEIDADNFITRYPEIKEYTVAIGSAEQTTYTRVYEQIIGEKTFYRVLLSYEQFSDKDFLDWKNIYFTQFLFFKRSTTFLLQIGNDAIFGSGDSNDNPEYTGFEIIEKNNTVIGIMHYSLSESDNSNKAKYSSWQNIVNASRLSLGPNIAYSPFNRSGGMEGIGITASKSLVDSRRPFMYTIQNAFDGNPATSYVEDTDDDMFSFQFALFNWDYDNLPKCTGYKIINGYASGDYYYQNNQIETASVGFLNYEGNTQYSLYESFQLYDTVQPQVMNFEAVEIIPYMDLTMNVEDIRNGTRYNDTAIAEFDLYFEGEGWVFGSSDTNTIPVSPTKANEYKYTIKSDGSAEIADYMGKETEVTIPSIISYRANTYTVTSIGYRAFKDSSLISLTIPDSVTSIGDKAFMDSRLTSIRIPTSVTSIGDWAFARTPLTSITIPNGVTSIGDWAFVECFALTSVTIPDSVTSIGDWAFSTGYNLTSITIPRSVRSIGERAFYSENVTLSVFPDTYALEYAIENDIPYILID